MTTEEDFNTLLDSNSKDYQTRLVYSDWLRDRSDLRADGYYVLGKYQFYGNIKVSFDYGCNIHCVWKRSYSDIVSFDGIPAEWFEKVDLCIPEGCFYHKIANTRKELEDAIAIAFNYIPEISKSFLLRI